MKMLKIACGEQTMIMTTASERFSKFISKTDKKLDRAKELFLRNSRITVCEVLTCVSGKRISKGNENNMECHQFQRAMRTIRNATNFKGQ